MELIATFPSSHAALRAERALLDAGMAVELIPVPRQIRSDCGFCLLTDGGHCGTPEAALRLDKLKTSGAQGLWQVLVTQADPSSRKVKSYERIP